MCVCVYHGHRSTVLEMDSWDCTTMVSQIDQREFGFLDGIQASTSTHIGNDISLSIASDFSQHTPRQDERTGSSLWLQYPSRIRKASIGYPIHFQTYLNLHQNITLQQPNSSTIPASGHDYERYRTNIDDSVYDPAT